MFLKTFFINKPLLRHDTREPDPIEGNKQWLNKCIFTGNELWEAAMCTIHHLLLLRLTGLFHQERCPHHKPKLISASNERSVQIHGCYSRSKAVHQLPKLLEPNLDNNCTWCHLCQAGICQLPRGAIYDQLKIQVFWRKWQVTPEFNSSTKTPVMKQARKVHSWDS